MSAKNVFEEKYKITSYLVNLRGRAGLYAILNLVQDVGWQHAIAMKVKLERNMAWVFTRQKLVMTEWPAWNEVVTIRTWLRPPGTDAFLLRDYELFVGDRKVGECTSTFTVMDMSTRKIAVVDWSGYASIWKNEDLLTHKPEKILFSNEVQDLAQFEVRNSDIDLNNHVNNTKYAQWILDAIPIDILRAGDNMVGYEVNFMAETKSGDLVTVQKTTKDQVDGATSVIQFQGVRNSDGKPVFTAQMRTIAATKP